jgi:hypothetical protein
MNPSPLDFSLGFTILRQALQVAAGYAVARGIADEATATAAAGALISLATAGWSIWVKRRTNAVAAKVTPAAA